MTFIITMVWEETSPSIVTNKENNTNHLAKKSSPSDWKIPSTWGLPKVEKPLAYSGSPIWCSATPSMEDTPEDRTPRQMQVIHSLNPEAQNDSWTEFKRCHVTVRWWAGDHGGASEPMFQSHNSHFDDFEKRVWECLIRNSHMRKCDLTRQWDNALFLSNY